MFVPVFVQTPISAVSLLAATVASERFAPLRPVKPAPLPVKLLDALLKLFCPVKVWLPSNNATLLESRASAIVPVKLSAGTEVSERLGTEPIRFDALRAV